MSQHTPGPWHYSDHISPHLSIYTVEGTQIIGIAGPLYKDHGGVGEANARLIAAAPDLLEACRECMKVVDESYDSTGFFKVAKSSEQRMKIEAAIAKATGEPIS